MMGRELQRFMGRIDRRSADGCWIWTAAISDTGYGTGRWERRNRLAHRLMFELYYGPIPAGLQLDHLCRVRACVNPEHLEPVTPKENSLRGESSAAQAARTNRCLRGHEFIPENTYIRPDTQTRICRTCSELRQQQSAAPEDYRPRADTCPAGHPYAGDNLYLNTRGYAQCKACHREKNRVAERRRRARLRGAS